MRILNIAAILVIVTATGARAETFPVITDQTVLSAICRYEAITA